MRAPAYRELRVCHVSLAQSLGPMQRVGSCWNPHGPNILTVRLPLPGILELPEGAAGNQLALLPACPAARFCLPLKERLRVFLLLLLTSF